MVSKKAALTLGVLAIGGVGVASMIAGGGGGFGEGSAQDTAQEQSRIGGNILGTTPKKEVSMTGYTIPREASVHFPKPPEFDFSKFFVKPEVSRGSAGVSSAPTKKEKYVDTGQVAVGYEGYKTPFTPTPFSPTGYWREAGTALGYEGYVTPTTPSPIAPKKTQFDRLPPGAGGSSGGKGMSGTALPGRPYISKKPV